MRKINDAVLLAHMMALSSRDNPVLIREDKATFDQFMERPVERPVAPLGGRNKTCQCGSGKKFKKCCWVQQKGQS